MRTPTKRGLILVWVAAALAWCCFIALIVLDSDSPNDLLLVALSANNCITIWAMLYTAVSRGRRRDAYSLRIIVDAVIRGLVSSGYIARPDPGDDNDPAEIAAVIRFSGERGGRDGAGRRSARAGRGPTLPRL